ncbi:hypothetical protein [Noviherbaspirillum galbum]|uniref:DUF4124 domain-containing protein n=1 Tax=Noviherbaspirillum galbum TaxID=2709383 RepID=A0A6B3SLI9_9BURK|nr:hypothetical protein [Noviherbaspirillum galbum]NEX61607.1 hypothetical protein [Noviherbaspirillum galbum]
MKRLFLHASLLGAASCAALPAISSSPALDAPGTLVYRCDNGGQIAYQNSPCRNGGGRVIESISPSPGEMASAHHRAAEDRHAAALLDRRDRPASVSLGAPDRGTRRASAKQEKCASLSRRTQLAREETAALGGQGKSSLSRREKRSAKARQLEDKARRACAADQPLAQRS